MKITLNFDKPLVDLDGAPIQPEIRLGPQLALALVGQSQGNVVKYYDWALSLHRGQPIEIDDSDFRDLRKFIEGCTNITILGKRQMLDLMDAAQKSAQTVA